MLISVIVSYGHVRDELQLNPLQLILLASLISVFAAQDEGMPFMTLVAGSSAALLFVAGSSGVLGWGAVAEDAMTTGALLVIVAAVFGGRQALFAPGIFHKKYYKC